MAMIPMRAGPDARVIGRVSVRHTLLALALFLSLIWIICLGNFMIEQKDEIYYDQYASNIALKVSPNTLDYCIMDSGLTCEKTDQPKYEIPYTKEQLQAGQLLYYDIAFGERDYKFSKENVDYENIAVCFYLHVREAAAAASQFSPSGDQFYRRTGIMSCEPIAVSPNPNRKIWQLHNTLIFYEGEDTAVIEALTEFLGTPAADGMSKAAVNPQSFLNKLYLLVSWNWWPYILFLALLAAVIFLCLYFFFFPPGWNKLTPEKFLHFMKGKGISVLKVEQVTIDPYGGFPEKKAVCNYVVDDASGARMVLGNSSQLANDAETIDRQRLISVLFFSNAKKAGAARSMLSDMGDRLEKKDGSIVRLGFSIDRVVVQYQNTLIYYNGRDGAVRTVLRSLQDTKAHRTTK